MHLTASELTETDVKGVDLDSIDLIGQRREMLAKLKQATGSVNETIVIVDNSILTRIRERCRQAITKTK